MQSCSAFTVFDFATDNFADLWSEVRPFFAGQTVATHDFDTGVLTETLGYYSLSLSELHVLDSLAVARSAWPKLTNHKLSTVTAHLNVPLNYHDADSDARACAEIILRAGQRHVEINRIIGRLVQERFDLCGGNY